MKTENSDSQKDLNANPESRLNTNKPVSKPQQSPESGRSGERFPESQQARDEMERVKHEQAEKKEKKKKDDDIELLADDVAGSVSTRDTGSNPTDIAGVADIDRGMGRARRK